MKIQKWLIAGKHNKYHPHLLRPTGLLLVVALLLSINLTYNVTATRSFQVLGYATSISAEEVISLSNQQRVSNGLEPLSTNTALTNAARAKAQDMIANNYWAHVSPSGKTPWDFIDDTGYSYSTAGENLAKDFDTSSGAVNGWMNSPGHRANILNASFKDTGIAVINGTLQGSETTLVVAMYAAPVTSIPAPTASVPRATPPPQTAPKAAAVVEQPAALPAPTAVEQAPVATPAAVKEAPSIKTPAVVPIPEVTKTIDEQAISRHESRTWAQNSSLFLLSTLFLVSVLKHTIVWRTHKRGWRHIWLRAHPAAQYSLLFVAILANIVSGIGVVK